jgi:hypothetical protein
MVIYSFQLKWSILNLSRANITLDLLDQYQLTPPGKDISPTNFETNQFLMTLCDLLDSRLGELGAVFDALSTYKAPADQEEPRLLHAIPPMPAMLSHGLVLTLKYCIEDLNNSGILVSKQTESKRTKSHTRSSLDAKNNRQVQSNGKSNSVWRQTIHRIMNLALMGLRTALQIVAETPVDNLFAPVPKIGAGKDHLLQSEIADEDRKNTHGYASDSFMLNTNVFMDLDDGQTDSNENKEDSIGRRMQYAVVGAWLLVKESCALLAKLVEVSPPPLIDSLEREQQDISSLEDTLLTSDEIANIGSVILDALSRLKHNGALQAVCESVLRLVVFSLD